MTEMAVSAERMTDDQRRLILPARIVFSGWAHNVARNETFRPSSTGSVTTVFALVANASLFAFAAFRSLQFGNGGFGIAGVW